MDFLNTEEKRQRRMVHLPMGRFGEGIEIAKGALFCKFPSKLQAIKLISVFNSGKRRQQLRNSEHELSF